MAQGNNPYEAQITPRGDMQQPVYHGQKFTSGFGEAAPAITRAINAVGDYANEKLDEDSKAWAANASSQADVAAQELLDAKKRSAADGAPKFKEDLLGDWKKYQDETLKNAPNGRTSELMTAHFNAVTESLTHHADEFQNTETDRWRNKMATDGVDADARLISSQKTEEINQSVEKSLGKWTSYYKTLNITPEARQALVDATREKITNAANMRAIQLDPKSYLAQNAMARNPQLLVTDPNAPRGIRNNNPGNLRTDAFAGTVGVDADGYGKFTTPEAGIRAMAKNLIVQQDKHGLNTVEDIITKYAPPTENNTAAYISSVAGAMGVGPADKLNMKDPATLQKMMGAMIKQENGSQPYSDAQINSGVVAAIEGKALPDSPTQTQGLNDGTRSPSSSTAFRLGTWEQQQKWINLAETEQRRLHAEHTANVAAANTLMGSVKERMQAGLALPEEEMKSIGATVAATSDPIASKKWQDLQATQSLTQSMQQLSPAQLSGVITSQLEPAAHRDGATEREALQLEISKKLLGTMTEKVASDAVSWAAQTGMQIAPLDFNKPETMPQRVANAQAISQKYEIPVEKALFSQAEKQQFASHLVDMPNELKLKLGKQMQAGFGPYFTRAVGEISEKDPLFSHAAFLSSLSAANDGTALDILTGQHIIKENPQLKPKKEDKETALADFGNAFEMMPRAAAGIVEAADALYAKRVGMVESFDSTAYSKAMQDVVGKTKAGTGGIGEFNGQKYLLPQQFTEDDFERGLQAMTPDELAAMSIGGGHAIYGRKNTPASGAELYSNVVFKSVAYGQYAAFNTDGSKVTSDKGPKGQFILAIDPSKFASIVQRANERHVDASMKRGEEINADRAGGGLQ